MHGLLPPEASTFAGDIDGVMRLITYVVGAWLVLTGAVLLYLVVRYRRRPGRRAAHVTGSSRRAMAIVLVPAALVLVCDVGIEASGAHVWWKVKEHLPTPAQTVKIDARQFVWKFTMPGPDGRLGTPDDVKALNRLDVPEGEVIAFDLTSEDVIHSFFVPALRLKQDAVPGRTIKGWFEATRPGHYVIECAQLCGVGHGIMRGTLVVHDPASWKTWLAAHTPGGAR